MVSFFNWIARVGLYARFSRPRPEARPPAPETNPHALSNLKMPPFSLAAMLLSTVLAQDHFDSDF